MDTHFLFYSSKFPPTTGETDDSHDDYINPGLYGLALGNFLAEKLTDHNYQIAFQCQEDWGHYIELKHDGKFRFALGCSNTGEERDGETEHRVFIEPNRPVIRRFFRKIDVAKDVEALSEAVQKILHSEQAITDIRIEED